LEEYTVKKMTKKVSALAAGVVSMSLLLGASAAQAATVLTDADGTAYGINDLFIPDTQAEAPDGRWNVRFIIDIYPDAYPGDPPRIDFLNGETVLVAIEQVNEELTLSGVTQVGPQGGDQDVGLYALAASPEMENDLEFMTWLGGAHSSRADAWISDFDGNPIAGAKFPDQEWMWAKFAPVPVPAAVWLFGSGLLGLIGISRRKKSA
jgi:hypothetical protein